MKDDSSSEAFEGPDPILEKLRPSKIENGVLIPLKTTLELRDDHHCSRVLITRAPVKMVAAVLNEIRILVPEEVVKGMPHLRRCCKCSDLPAHLKTQFMNDTPHSRQIHTGKSSWVYIMIGLEAAVPRRELIGALSKAEGMEECGVFTATIPVPLFPPTSQVQAALWSGHFWPTVYRKNNPLGPHPSMVTRATEEITDDAPFWMALAHQVAAKTNAAGYGEAMGACIIQRSSNGSTRLVALAGDARWHKQSKAGCTGNPMAHCVLRAISMVAQKLVRAENRDGEETVPPILEFEAFQDAPLVDDEQLVFGQEHPSPDGYLCHGLELYMTHEPCVMCSMAILHSRMGRATFSKRMPLTGGLSAEDRALGYPHHPHLSDIGGGHGLGLFWRRELNWSLLAWEWEPTDACNPLLVGPEVHV